jgi:hypothetical protein
MFSLHERTQRHVCQIAFVLACAVPTVFTIAWSLYFNRPWQELDWQQTLEHALHVRTTVSDVAAPRPWQRVFASLKFASLEASQPLGEFRRFRFESRNSFAAEHLTLYWNQLAELARVFEIWLSDDTFQTTKWQVESAKLASSTGSSYEFKGLLAESGISSRGVRQITIRAEIATGQRVRLLIERANAGQLRASLDTQQGWLPTWLVGDVVPSASRWGQANFSGVLQLEKSPERVVGQYRGSIDSIDTQQWIGTDQLRTHVSLQFDMLSWADDRIEIAQGEFKTAEGQIQHELLQALQERLYCTVAANGTDKTEYRPFQRAACRFKLDNQGLTVSGACAVEGTLEGCLVVANEKPLVMQPGYSNLPVAHLVQVFCPLDSFWLPATREATSMAERLPLPEAPIRQR